MRRIVVLVGLPGSGKTTFARQLENQGWWRISQDSLGNRALCETEFQDALDAGHQIVVDRCNHTERQRSTWIRLAEKHMADGAELIAVMIGLPLHECIRRVEKREGHPTLRPNDAKKVVHSFAAEFEHPTRSEGFHSVMVSRNARDLDDCLHGLINFQEANYAYKRQTLHQRSHHPRGDGHFPAHCPAMLPNWNDVTDVGGPYTAFQPWWQHLLTTGFMPSYTHSEQEQEQEHEQDQYEQQEMQPPTNNALPPKMYSVSPWRMNANLPMHAPNIPVFHQSVLGAGNFMNGGIPPFGPMAGQWDGGMQRMGNVKKPEDVQGRITLLFDLNGTITSHTSRRKSAGSTALRPGTEQLKRLKDKFRLGIFTSSSEKTVKVVKEMVEDALEGELFDQDVILSRFHTQNASRSLQMKFDLKPWATVKPLHQWFEKTDRVVLFDDDPWKALPEEDSNMVKVPCWLEDNPDCTMLETLVNATLDVLGDLPKNADVRKHTEEINERLRAHAAQHAIHPLSGSLSMSLGLESDGKDTEEGVEKLPGLGKAVAHPLLADSLGPFGNNVDGCVSNGSGQRGLMECGVWRSNDQEMGEGGLSVLHMSQGLVGKVAGQQHRMVAGSNQCDVLDDQDGLNVDGVEFNVSGHVDGEVLGKRKNRESGNEATVDPAPGNIGKKRKKKKKKKKAVVFSEQIDIADDIDDNDDNDHDHDVDGNVNPNVESSMVVDMLGEDSRPLKKQIKGKKCEGGVGKRVRTGKRKGVSDMEVDGDCIGSAGNKNDDAVIDLTMGSTSCSPCVSGVDDQEGGVPPNSAAPDIPFIKPKPKTPRKSKKSRKLKKSGMPGVS